MNLSRELGCFHADYTWTNEQQYILFPSLAKKVSELAFEEFNGFPGKNGFNASPKLSQRIAAQLIKPFMFDYASGHIGDIHAPPEVSDTVVNIVRGILGFLQVTVKTTQRVYELEEVSDKYMNLSTSQVETW